MKRLSALILTVLLSISLVACSCVTQADTQGANVAHCTENDIRALMERNLDCYTLYYISPAPVTTQQNSDGYLGVDKNFLSDYKTLSDLVTTTYTADKAAEILNYPSKETPLYKDVQGNLFVKPDLVEFNDYEWSFSEYTVKIDSDKDNKCTFTLKTEEGSQTYETTGTAVYENGKWLLTDIIH